MEVRLVSSCSRKLVVLVAAVKETPRTAWVTEIEPIEKVLLLDQSRSVERLL